LRQNEISVFCRWNKKHEKINITMEIGELDVRFNLQRQSPVYMKHLRKNESRETAHGNSKMAYFWQLMLIQGGKNISKIYKEAYSQRCEGDRTQYFPHTPENFFGVTTFSRRREGVRGRFPARGCGAHPVLAADGRPSRSLGVGLKASYIQGQESEIFIPRQLP